MGFMYKLAVVAGVVAGFSAFDVRIARADSFELTYTFDDDNVVTATFDGDVSISDSNLIENLSNIRVFFDGTAATNNPLYGWGHRAGGWDPGEAVISFDGLANDFQFIDGDSATSSANFTQYLTSNHISGVIYVTAVPVLGTVWQDYKNPAFDAASWNITMTSAVPEPGTWALLGMGVLGLAYQRRRKLKAS